MKVFLDCIQLKKLWHSEKFADLGAKDLVSRPARQWLTALSQVTSFPTPTRISPVGSLPDAHSTLCCDWDWSPCFPTNLWFPLWAWSMPPLSPLWDGGGLEFRLSPFLSGYSETSPGLAHSRCLQSLLYKWIVYHLWGCFENVNSKW
jgi:hypothetical protein